MDFWNPLLDINGDVETDAMDLWLLHQITEYEKAKQPEEEASE